MKEFLDNVEKMRKELVIKKFIKLLKDNCECKTQQMILTFTLCPMMDLMWSEDTVGYSLSLFYKEERQIKCTYKKFLSRDMKAMELESFLDELVQELYQRGILQPKQLWKTLWKIIHNPVENSGREEVIEEPTDSVHSAD